MTYTDTPLNMQAAKYVVFILIILLYFLWGILRKRFSGDIKTIERISLVVYAILICYPVLLFIFNPKPYFIETAIFFIMLIPALAYKPVDISVKSLSNQFIIFIWISIVWEIMQIALYHLAGRLPALAWATAASVRYGSIWDDPNGYAVFMSFMIPFVYFRYYRQPWLMAGLEGILLVFLILTQSMTGMAALCLSLLMGGGILILGRAADKKTLLGLLAVVPIFLLMITFYYFSSPLPADVMEEKSQSIEGHKAAWLVMQDYLSGEGSLSASKPNELRPWRQNRILKQLGDRVTIPARWFVQTESGYVNIVINIGWFYLLIYLMAGFLGLIMLYQVLLHEYSGPGLDLFYAAYFFIIGYFLALLNLPLEEIFPINILMVVSLLIGHVAWVKRKEFLYSSLQGAAS